MAEHIRCRTVMKGPGPQELIVEVKTASGASEQVVVDQSDVSEGYLTVSIALKKDGNNRLVELPRESTRGNWRLWVPKEEFAGK